MSNDAQIRDIVRQEIARQQSSDRFRLSPISRHIHNGVDSPFVLNTTQVFGGRIPYDPTDTSLQMLLPTGWKIVRESVGLYRITHNLGTDFYSVTASGTQSTNEVVIPIILQFPQFFYITWFDDTGTFQEVDTSFNFILVLVNNRSESPPSYTAKNMLAEGQTS